MENFVTGAIWTGVMISLVNFVDQNVPNSLGYYIDIYTPF
jgi:hypothetical protein